MDSIVTGVTVRQRVIEGHPARVLLDAADGADLLVWHPAMGLNLYWNCLSGVHELITSCRRAKVFPLRAVGAHRIGNQRPPAPSNVVAVPPVI